MKQTKIVATLGPASIKEDVLRAMFMHGVDVCRLNFSHGSYDQHLEAIEWIRKLNSELGKSVAILADLQGPKLRVGEMEDEFVLLEEGKTIAITTRPMKGTGERIHITYQNFPKDVQAGENILLDDGKLLLEVISTNREDEVIAKVISGGKLFPKKGVNLPNTEISLPCLTEKDRNDLDFALKQSVDWVGLSFVRSVSDIEELRSIIKAQKSKARIVAKIEKPEALKEIDAIIEATDAVMVARGDLGVEIPMENVPLVQKEIIKKCLKNARPVIVATQMMESMIDNISPTRAEVNDVANAVLDGADAVMLSGETSVGKHPEKVIEAMNKIVSQVETSDTIFYKETPPVEDSLHDRFLSDSICYNACRLAHRVKAKAIVTMTYSGYTAFKVSSQRPRARIFVFTGNKNILTTLSLVWGVTCIYYDKMVSTDDTIHDIKTVLRDGGYVVEKDIVINIASMPIKERGMANMLKVSYI